MAVEHDIVKLFDSNLRGFYTINAIAAKLGKAYPYVHRKVHSLLALGVLRSVQVGNSHCCTINLRNRRAVLYLTELELEKRSHLPAQTQELTRQLETDGTLAIETVVYGNNTVYVLGSGNYPGTKTITAHDLKELLLTTDLFKHHTVLYGYERFFTHLASIQADLDRAYNPLVTVNQ
jgi:hypothetical protein